MRLALAVAGFFIAPHVIRGLTREDIFNGEGGLGLSLGASIVAAAVGYHFGGKL